MSLLLLLRTSDEVEMIATKSRRLKIIQLMVIIRDSV